jgi:hypothetical protein
MTRQQMWLVGVAALVVIVLVGLWWVPGQVFSDPDGLGTELCEAGATCGP